MASFGECSASVKTEFIDHSYTNEGIEEYPLFVKMEVEEEPSQTSIQKRKAKISFEQKKLMIEFLTAHPEMIAPSSSLHHVNASRPLWTELAYLLENSCLGARGKTLEEWKRTWQDLKSTTKKRANEVANNKTIAGGPPKPLNDVEIAVLNLMKNSVAVPSPGDNESSLETQCSQNDEPVDSLISNKSTVQPSTRAVTSRQLETSQPNPSNVPRPSRTHVQNQRNLLRKRRKLAENRILKKFISVQEERNKLKREELEIKKKMSEAKLEMIQGMIKYFNTGTETMLEVGKAFQKLQN